MPSFDATGKNVDELLAGPYKEVIATLKANADVQAAIAKYKDENEEYGFLVDDIFLLRYAISHTDDVPHAVKAIVDTLEWRHENQALLRPYHIAVDPATGKEVRRDPMDLVRDSTTFRKLNQHLPGFNEFAQYDATSYHGETIYGTPVLYLRPGIARVGHASENITSAENIKNMFLMSNEPALMVCDQIARGETTRNLVECIAIIDAKGMNHRSIPSNDFRKLQFVASLECDLYYPHTMGKMYITNVPMFLTDILEEIVKAMPSSVSKKAEFVEAPKPNDVVAARLKMHGMLGNAAWKIEDTFHGVAYDSLPSFLGGGCRCGKPRVDFETGKPQFDGTQVDRTHGLPVGWCIDGLPNNLAERIPNWKKIKMQEEAEETKKVA